MMHSTMWYFEITTTFLYMEPKAVVTRLISVVSNQELFKITTWVGSIFITLISRAIPI